MDREELLRSARNLYENPSTNEALKVVLEDTYPELKESEDERIRRALIKQFSAISMETWAGIPKIDIIAYLEKQKEQKPAEWSEEDAAMLESIIKDYDYLCRIWLQDYEKRLGGADCEARIDIRNQITWLKSLRLQSHWKPSVEQISALDCVAGAFSPNNKEYRMVMHHINTLRNMLKQL